MKSSFFMGIAIALAAYLIGFLSNNYNVTLKITGFVVIVSFFIAGILNGTFISGDRYRANFMNETKEDRDKNENGKLFAAIVNTKCYYFISDNNI